MAPTNTAPIPRNRRKDRSKNRFQRGKRWEALRFAERCRDSVITLFGSGELNDTRSGKAGPQRSPTSSDTPSALPTAKSRAARFFGSSRCRSPYTRRRRPTSIGVKPRQHLRPQSRSFNSAHYGRIIGRNTEGAIQEVPSRRKFVVWRKKHRGSCGYSLLASRGLLQQTGSMPEEAAKIEAKSQRQAMEWSLVLASQNIESVIDCGPDEKAWGLLVSPVDYRKAAEAVQLYQEENRHWPWRKQVLRGGLLFDWTSLLWVVVLCLFYVIAAEQPAMVGRGLMDSVAVNHGEIWRMFTAMWLHADLGHLASNATMGIVLLGLTMGRYGSGTGLLAAYLAGFGVNVAVWLFSLGHASLGAS